MVKMVMGKGQRNPKIFQILINIVNDADTMEKGSDEGKFPRIRLTKMIGDELFKVIFEMQPGKKNRAISLVSMVIKTGK